MLQHCVKAETVTEQAAERHQTVVRELRWSVNEATTTGHERGAEGRTGDTQ